MAAETHGWVGHLRHRASLEGTYIFKHADDYGYILATQDVPLSEAT